MDALLLIFGLGAIVIIAVLILGFVHYLDLKIKFRKQAAIHKTRMPLSDKDFCERMGLETKDVSLVSEIRKALAKRGGYNPDRIYPDDELWDAFDFQLSDFIEEFTMQFIECGYGDLPCEEFKQVSDLIKYIVTHQTIKKSKE